MGTLIILSFGINGIAATARAYAGRALLWDSAVPTDRGHAFPKFRGGCEKGFPIRFPRMFEALPVFMPQGCKFSTEVWIRH